MDGYLFYNLCKILHLVNHKYPNMKTLYGVVLVILGMLILQTTAISFQTLDVVFPPNVFLSSYHSTCTERGGVFWVSEGSEIQYTLTDNLSIKTAPFSSECGVNVHLTFVNNYLLLTTCQEGKPVIYLLNEETWETELLEDLSECAGTVPCILTLKEELPRNLQLLNREETTTISEIDNNSVFYCAVYETLASDEEIWCVEWNVNTSDYDLFSGSVYGSIKRIILEYEVLFVETYINGLTKMLPTNYGGVGSMQLEEYIELPENNKVVTVVVVYPFPRVIYYSLCGPERVCCMSAPFGTFGFLKFSLNTTSATVSSNSNHIASTDLEKGDYTAIACSTGYVGDSSLFLASSEGLVVYNIPVLDIIADTSTTKDIYRDYSFPAYFCPTPEAHDAPYRSLASYKMFANGWGLAGDSELNYPYEKRAPAGFKMGPFKLTIRHTMKIYELSNVNNINDGRLMMNHGSTLVIDGGHVKAHSASLSGMLVIRSLSDHTLDQETLEYLIISYNDFEGQFETISGCGEVFYRENGVYVDTSLCSEEPTSEVPSSCC